MKQIYKKRKQNPALYDNRNDSHQSAVWNTMEGIAEKMFWHGGAVFIRSSVFQNGISMAAMSKNFHQNRGQRYPSGLRKLLRGGKISICSEKFIYFFEHIKQNWRITYEDR